MARPRAAIVGVSGPRLTAAEAALFRAAPPLGAILFARNIVDPDQLRALTAELREALGADAPILVDQEGGQVARLRPPLWPAFPPAAGFTAGPEAAARANAALLGLACADVGFDVVCAPVLDLRIPGAHDIIGDRSFGEDPAEVARLGRATIEGLQEAGCIPVIKHIPGHGRALVDSHLDLPRVTAGKDDLALDCAPFAALAAAGAWAMTAHILYEALDAERPATLSPLVIERVIRGAIGFAGVLVSDDLCMKALRGDPGALAAEAIDAGCDLVLHCNGVLEETAAALAGCPALSEAAEARLAEARAAMQAMRRPLDSAALLAQRDAWLAAA
ncbi:beta-N-acetylhexosaminidase [Paracraurococcus lichenis]|uniref:beta-N-acetylhexosaminidase n=1 Tax=Paracraurococcus lichenis TaxID=3064888 RepID=A0ABT9E8C1_9PROT|nr:beta-N-acetylhexosaminidase [Paracraurococcus sp. LOR1-02]MDO9712435.1 beta-N-acetylhexosaminidase [Paracraurococcus sp. LOR1-02]